MQREGSSSAQATCASLSILALSMLLSGGPAVGQGRPAPPAEDLRAAPDRPGWSVDAPTGCWLWNPFPQPNETATWSGHRGPDGRASGRGEIVWRHNGGVENYVGEVRDGTHHGFGRHIGANGATTVPMDSARRGSMASIISDTGLEDALAMANGAPGLAVRSGNAREPKCSGLSNRVIA